MNSKRQSGTWEKVLGMAELATVVFYTWKKVKQNSDESNYRRVPVQGVRSARREIDKPQAAPLPAPTQTELSTTPCEAMAELVKGEGFSFKTLYEIAIAAAKSWSVHRAASKGAALALYTLFSLAPMLVLVVAVAGLFIGADEVRALVQQQMSGMLGAQGADAVKSMLAGAQFESDSITAALISIALVLIGATTAFSELKDSLDELWEIPENKEGGIWRMVRQRFLSFGLVLVLALMLLTSLAVSTALSALGNIWIGGVENASYVLFAKLVSSTVSFMIVAALFAAIYKYLPAAAIAWRDVIIGAFITAILFIIGKFLIGLYLESNDFSSAYGAAGSLVLMVSWIYYSAQIFFYGALFTHEHAVRRGRARPTTLVVKPAGEPVLSSAASPS